MVKDRMMPQALRPNVQQLVFHRQGRPSAAHQGQVNRNPIRAAFGRPPFILITEWASKQSTLYIASMQKKKRKEIRPTSSQTIML